MNLKELKIEEFITGLADILKTYYKYPKKRQENSVEELILTFLRICYFKIENQVSQGDGIIDIKIQDDKTRFIIELEVDQTAKVALNQIIDKKYFIQENRKDKQCVLIGINYSNAKGVKNINSFAVKKINCGTSEAQVFYDTVFEDGNYRAIRRG